MYCRWGDVAWAGDASAADAPDLGFREAFAMHSALLLVSADGRLFEWGWEDGAALGGLRRVATMS